MTQTIWAKEFCRHEHTTIDQGWIERCDICGETLGLQCMVEMYGLKRLERLCKDRHSLWQIWLAVILFKLTGFICYRINGLTRWQWLYVGNLAKIVISFGKREVAI